MSVYKFVELVGTSTDSWEDAAASAIQIASKTIPDPRIAEVEKLDLQVLGEQITFRAKLKVSFKVDQEGEAIPRVSASRPIPPPKRRTGRRK